MVDVFEEVEEQLRSDRYRTLASKGWPYALGLVLILIVGFAGYWAFSHHNSTKAAAASEAYAAAAEAGARNDLADAEKRYAEVGKTGPDTYKALALMQVAGVKEEQGKAAEAAALLDQAAGAIKEPLVKDAAALKAAYVLFDTLSLDDLKKRLDPLAAPGRPYAALAREALAMKQMVSGKLNEARTSFAVLSLLPDATDDLRARAQASLALIDSGSAKVLPDVLAAAKILPPSTQPSAAAVGSAAAPPVAGPSAPAQSAPVQSAPAESPPVGAAQ